MQARVVPVWCHAQEGPHAEASLDVDQAEEAEMQEFLDRLDFDDYFSDWVSLATSVSSADLLGASTAR